MEGTCVSLGVARAKVAGDEMDWRRRERTDDAAWAESDADEAALVARAKEDRRAFAPLYARYLGPVLRYCERRLGDPTIAEDAAGQVFAQAMANLNDCREDAFRPWLFAIARNIVVDIYRRRRPATALETVPERVDTDPTPEEAALAREESDSLRSLLVHLTPDQRRVVELRLAGFTGVEIAEALGLSHGAVKLHQFRAIRRLRSVLGIEPSPGGNET